MGKFNKGDLVFGKNAVPGFGPLWEVVSSDEEWVRLKIGNGEIVSREAKNFQLYNWSETPEEIICNGVTYIRKPEPEHVWKFGDWARVKDGVSLAGEVVFVTGPIGKYGSVPFALNGHHTRFHADGHKPENLEYISSAIIPE